MIVECLPCGPQRVGRTDQLPARTLAGQCNDADVVAKVVRPDIERRIGEDLELPVAEWDDPYENRPWCTKSAQLIISDVNPSYDSDSVPGSAFSGFSGDLSGASVSTEGSAIWSAEFGGSRDIYIGQVGNDTDNAPTAKTASSFGNIRGLSPAEPTKLGSYYSAALARYAYNTDLRPSDDIPEDQNLQTFSVALASPLPKIEIPINDQIVTLVPFAKSTDGYGIDEDKDQFQPTNTIVDFYIEEWVNFDDSNMDLTVNKGLPLAVFRINFEDVEQGADHDMDAIVRYVLSVTEQGRLDVQLISEYAAGSIEQQMGYVISGTTRDGVYMEVRDCDTSNPNGEDVVHPAVSTAQCSGNNPGSTKEYFLRTPTDPRVLSPLFPAYYDPDFDPVNDFPAPGDCDASNPANDYCDQELPLWSRRQFEVSADPAAIVLNDPLWYAAKYGADGNENLPDGEDPENYFLVTNASTLASQLSEAFERILNIAASSGTTSSSGRLTEGTVLYETQFDTADWTGDIVGREAITQDVLWRATNVLQSWTQREIYTANVIDTDTGEVEGVAFDESLPDAARDRMASDLDTDTQNMLINYIRGDQSNERMNGGPLRNRSVLIGDIVNSQLKYMGQSSEGWSILEDEGEAYSSFVENTKQNRDPALFVGSNDGMLHALDAETGTELFSYIPGTVLSELRELAKPNYPHRYYVDGQVTIRDAYIDGSWRTILVGGLGAGGRAIYALDVTDPENFDPDSDVLWELNDPDLGHTYGAPAITHLGGRVRQRLQQFHRRADPVRGRTGHRRRAAEDPGLRCGRRGFPRQRPVGSLAAARPRRPDLRQSCLCRRPGRQRLAVRYRWFECRPGPVGQPAVLHRRQADHRGHHPVAASVRWRAAALRHRQADRKRRPHPGNGQRRRDVLCPARPWLDTGYG